VPSHKLIFLYITCPPPPKKSYGQSQYSGKKTEHLLKVNQGTYQAIFSFVIMVFFALHIRMSLFLFPLSLCFSLSFFALLIFLSESLYPLIFLFSFFLSVCTQSFFSCIYLTYFCTFSPLILLIYFLALLIFLSFPVSISLSQFVYPFPSLSVSSFSLLAFSLYHINEQENIQGPHPFRRVFSCTHCVELTLNRTTWNCKLLTSNTILTINELQFLRSKSLRGKFISDRILTYFPDFLLTKRLQKIMLKVL